MQDEGSSLHSPCSPSQRRFEPNTSPLHQRSWPVLNRLSRVLLEPMRSNLSNFDILRAPVVLNCALS